VRSVRPGKSKQSFNIDSHRCNSNVRIKQTAIALHPRGLNLSRDDKAKIFTDVQPVQHLSRIPQSMINGVVDNVSKFIQDHEFSSGGLGNCIVATGEIVHKLDTKANRQRLAGKLPVLSSGALTTYRGGTRKYSRLSERYSHDRRLSVRTLNCSSALDGEAICNCSVIGWIAPGGTAVSHRESPRYFWESIPYGGLPCH